MSVDLSKEYYMEVVAVPVGVLQGQTPGLARRAGNVVAGVAGVIPGVGGQLKQAINDAGTNPLDMVEFIRVRDAQSGAYEWYQFNKYPNGTPHELVAVADPKVDEANIKVLAKDVVQQPDRVDYTSEPLKHPLLRAFKGAAQLIRAEHVNLAAEHRFVPVPQPIINKKANWWEDAANAFNSAINLSLEDANLSRASRRTSTNYASSDIASEADRAALLAREQMQRLDNTVGSLVGKATLLGAGLGFFEVVHRAAEPVMEATGAKNGSSWAKIVQLGARVGQILFGVTFALSELYRVTGKEASLRKITEGGLTGVNRVALGVGERFQEAGEFVFGKGGDAPYDKSLTVSSIATQAKTAAEAFMDSLDAAVNKDQAVTATP